MLQLTEKTSGGIINVGSPTALIYTGGIHMDNNSLSHTKWNCKYHIVFAPKYRRKVAYGKIKQDIADILSMLCKRKGIIIVYHIQSGIVSIILVRPAVVA